MGVQGTQREVPLVATTGEQDVSGQEKLQNLYPRKTSGGKYSFTLIGTPGKAFVLELPTFPIKAVHRMGDRLFAVTPTKMYEWFVNGSYKELGDVSLSGRVMADDNGYQIVWVDGIRGYYYDDNTKEVKQITGDGWYPSRSVTYQDGYFIFVRLGTGQFFLSELLDVAFDPNDQATAEGQPDTL